MDDVDFETLCIISKSAEQMRFHGFLTSEEYERIRADIEARRIVLRQQETPV